MQAFAAEVRNYRFKHDLNLPEPKILSRAPRTQPRLASRTMDEKGLY